MNYKELFELQRNVHGTKSKVIVITRAILEYGYDNGKLIYDCCGDKDDALDLAFTLVEEMTGDYVEPLVGEVLL